MLAWLSVWSEVQTCIWPSGCHCHSLSLALVKSRLVYLFLYRPTRVVREKGLLNGCVCVIKMHVSVALSGQRPQFVTQPPPQVRPVEPRILAPQPQTPVIIHTAPSSYPQPQPQPVHQISSVHRPPPQQVGWFSHRLSRTFCLQCFDTVGRAAGRASSL